uniref:restriction endonuclease subunit S n=1 Tax=uncultured Tenacibaculum sp. TaxID=174713 RepID=UPI00262BB6DF|nr:restriction endonuclease subunit S [uncultured Tenacibaculum sp.]
MNGVSLSPYKLLKPYEFSYVTVTSRNGGKISLAINDSDETYLVSSSYLVFKSKNIKQLLPEYLFLLISREEFDRFSRFNSWGSARETFDWSEFCRIQIPLPDIDTQQELVDTYNGLKALAEQNEALIEPLTQACQAYIVDCKKKYPEVELGNYIEQRREKFSGSESLPIRGVSSDGFIPPKQKDADISKYNVFYKNDFVFNPARMEINSIALNVELEKGICSSLYEVFSVDESSLMPKYLNLFIKRSEFARQCEYIGFGSAREYCRVSNISEIKFPLPPPEVQQAIVNLYNCAEEAKKIANEAREKMKTLCPALVQKAING